MKITVAGAGYVGLVTSVCLSELGHRITCIDVQREKIEMLQSGRSPIYEPGMEAMLEKNLGNGQLNFTIDIEQAFSDCDIVFIAVGTPEKHDGTVDLTSIYEISKIIAQHIKKDVIICTKSTVPVGTNSSIKNFLQSCKPPNLKIEVVSNPEFLREGSAILDFFHGDRIVIGSDNPDAAAEIEKIYFPLGIPIIKTDLKSAEMIKYASNAFLATKISFINEIANICEKVGANIDEVAHGIGSDKRIGQSFLHAGIGFGGSCFPKDTKALVQLAGTVEHPFELLNAVIKVNTRQHSLPVLKAKETLGSLRGKRVALLGLAFKPETDDIREAASLTIVKDLRREGAYVTAYDPVAVPNAKKVLGNTIAYTSDIRQALADADIAIIATEWDQIKHVPLKVYCTDMKKPIVIDGRNCYSMEEILKYPMIYRSIGRPDVNQLTKMKV
jgi:UDPglucose 6-dehydrogenase